MPAVMTRSITIFVLVALFAWPSAALAQKKALDHDTYEIWNRIGSRSLSNDGAWALYTFSPEKGDGTLHVKSLTGNTLHEVPRGSSPGFTEDSRFVIFQIEPAEDSVRAAKKAKVKDDEMPKDTLGILDLTTGVRITCRASAHTGCQARPAACWPTCSKSQRQIRLARAHEWCCTVW